MACRPGPGERLQHVTLIHTPYDEAGASPAPLTCPNTLTAHPLALPLPPLQSCSPALAARTACCATWAGSPRCRGSTRGTTRCWRRCATAPEAPTVNAALFHTVHVTPAVPCQLAAIRAGRRAGGLGLVPAVHGMPCWGGSSEPNCIRDSFVLH